MIKLGVIGHPIAHSLSPSIHQSFAQELGLHVQYEKILSPLDEFDRTVNELIKLGYTGANVTAPFKENAFRLASHLSERTKHARSVNSLIFKNGEIFGDNTDGQGLIKGL